MKGKFRRKPRESRRHGRHRQLLPHGNVDRPLIPNFELLERRVMLAADFGDAPIPYPTTFAEFGPSHTIVFGAPKLGAAVDMEVNGTHSATANADGSDDDGVTFGSMQVGALDAMVTVNVQGGPGKLDAWIDFNGDGSWGGAGGTDF